MQSQLHVLGAVSSGTYLRLRRGTSILKSQNSILSSAERFGSRLKAKGSRPQPFTRMASHNNKKHTSKAQGP